jgi:hypothetical protein
MLSFSGDTANPDYKKHIVIDTTISDFWMGNASNGLTQSLQGGRYGRQCHFWI